MGSPELPARSSAPKDHTISSKRTKVVKKKAPTVRKPKQLGRRYMNGLMKAEIPARSELMKILNNFGFDNLDTCDRWILCRPLGQRRLIVSVDMPFGYYSLYKDGFRKLLRQTFPGIARVNLHTKMAEMSQRIVTSTWFHTVPTREPLNDTKQRFVDQVKKKEGDGIEVGWYSGTANSLVYLHY
ncbi:uncharacterized protein J4E84_005987 [Alternaria hordeiaustralica]|uniref:uncharacterized protein n=1 Tax=Alternaria hordeiaustralica TaxID=1187925 RepID=UPI0020C56A84|nr:uncharacterized protein J4E84_005987 [Alternaria hordeiaustralica]KAI4685260.1 hypothetical protein J4E84_005987 [Alternaria hordeiaustralica]